MKNEIAKRFLLNSKKSQLDSIQYIATLDCFENHEQTLEIIIQPASKARTDRQNRYLWGVVYQTIANEDVGFFNSEINALQLHSAGLKLTDLIHAFYKQMFLKRKAIQFNDSIAISIEASTSNLSALEFARYVKEIQRHASLHFNIYIPDPMPHEMLQGFAWEGA